MAFKTRKNLGITRKLTTEKLEGRSMMASDIAHNFLFPHDVDDDGSVTPLDALVLINHLNRGSDDTGSTTRQFHDVDDDSKLSPLDALSLINNLNSKSAIPAGNALVISQSSALINSAANSRVRVELETVGGETELKIRIDNAPVSTSLAVSLRDIALGQMVTDSRGRGQLVLSRGDDNRSHLPLPSEITSLSPEMELVIGDVVRGKLSQVAKVENTAVGNGGGTVSPPATSAQTLRFVAPFNIVNGVSRSAEFEQETERGVTKRKFEAEIQKVAPNANIEVTVNGIVVGNIATDSKGKGKLRLTTNPKDARDQPMPANFPAVVEGTIVKIGSVESTFRRAP